MDGARPRRMWRCLDAPIISLDSRNMADGWTCQYSWRNIIVGEHDMHGLAKDAGEHDMHGLAKDAVVRSLERAGKQARPSRLHASLAPPPQARQRGRRIDIPYMDRMATVINSIITVCFMKD